METVLYALLFVLIGVVGWLLWDRSAVPQRPQTIYIQQEAPVQPNRYEAWPRFWDAWWPMAGWPKAWWGESPWNYRYSYNRLYDFGWPWRSRGNEEVHPSRYPDEKPMHRPRPPPPINPTIHIQLPPPVNTVTQPTQAPPTLPLRSPLPEPIPTIHSGPMAPPAAPPAPTAPVQVQTPETFVPGSPPADKGYTL